MATNSQGNATIDEGTEGRKTLEAVKDIGISRVLMSYYYVENENWYHLLDEFDDVFLDSGAFTAYKSGEPISVEEYAEFLHEYKDKLEVYANLDVIENPEGTWENQKILEDQGLEPLPVFHFGSPWAYLDRLIDEGYNYILLGGMVGQRKNHLIEWCTQCFARIPDDVKVHAFGVADQSLLEMFPWYSADASNWVDGRRFGTTFYFDRGEMQSYKSDGQSEWAGRVAGSHYAFRDVWNIRQWKQYADYLESVTHD